MLKNRPEDHSVRAIIVYPMNALINSQLAALQAFARRTGRTARCTFGRYTGQDRGKDRDRDPHRSAAHPAHQLRDARIHADPSDGSRADLHQATRALKFLAVDELHVYRGRQGADVAMLMRRVRQRAGRDDLLCIGTSATLATGEDRARRRDADRGGGRSALRRDDQAGATSSTRQLRRVTTAAVPATREALRSGHSGAAAGSRPSTPSRAIRSRLGLRRHSGSQSAVMAVLERRKPLAFEDGLKQLVEKSGFRLNSVRACAESHSRCWQCRRAAPGEPVFAFRLHQFLASGGSVYATLEGPDRRSFSTRRGSTTRRRRPGRRKSESCIRSRSAANAARSTTSRSSRARKGWRRALSHARHCCMSLTTTLPGDPGFVSLEDGSLWSEDEDLPDNFVRDCDEAVLASRRTTSPRPSTHLGDR